MRPDLTVPTLILADAGHDDAVALLAPGRLPLRYAALRRQTAATVAVLRQAGIRRADTVAVVLPNGPELAAVALTVASGAICAPLNPGLHPEDFRLRLGDLEPAALLIGAGDEGLRPIAASLGVRCIDVCVQPGAAAGTFALDVAAAASAADEAPAQPDDTALLLHTSGTTSRPKLVSLTHRNLCHSALHVGATLALSPRDRALNMMPLFHIHGLVASLLASLAAGASVACCPGYRDGRFLPWLEALRPTWYTAAPAIHQAVLAELRKHSEGVAASRLRFARSASAPLPVPVLHALEAAFRAPVIEAYGMTEAAHQIASNPLPPGERRPRSVGLPAGPDVAIMDSAQQPLPAGAVGEIVIRGANVTAGYCVPREANVDAFAAGWLRTGDLGFLDADGYLHITGRLKEQINRAGEKISPAEIDAALLDHPGVRMAAAFAIAHPTMGEDIAAAVVLKDGATTSATELRAFLFGRISEWKIPNQIVVVDGIPTSATGKVARGELEAALGSRLRPAFVAPRDESEREIAALFGEVLGQRDVGAHDSFFALGGDSLRGFQLLARIRVLWHIDVPILDLFKEPTVAQVAATTVRARAERERAVLERILSELEHTPDAEAARNLLREPHGG